MSLKAAAMLRGDWDATSAHDGREAARGRTTSPIKSGSCSAWESFSSPERQASGVATQSEALTGSYRRGGEVTDLADGNDRKWNG